MIKIVLAGHGKRPRVEKQGRFPLERPLLETSGYESLK